VKCRHAAVGRWRAEVRAAEPPKDHPLKEKGSEQRQTQTDAQVTPSEPERAQALPALGLFSSGFLGLTGDSIRGQSTAARQTPRN